MFEQIFKRAKIRRRLAASRLAIILHDFVGDLQSRGYTPFSIKSYVRTLEHFGRWLTQKGIPTRHISKVHIQEFLLHHLPRCRCPKPASKSIHRCRAGLGLFLKFLRARKLITDSEKKTSGPKALDRLIAAYDQHLNQVCGLSDSTRRARQHYAREFLKWRFGRRRLRLRQLKAEEVMDFVTSRARELSCSGSHDLTVSLRSFLRFLEFSRRIRVGFSDVVARPVQRPSHQPPKALNWKEWQRFLNSFPRGTPSGQRDYAIALCLSLLALRAGEVAALNLDDLNWRELTLRLGQTKQRRERLLPLPDRVARALVKYLQYGRPPTQSRALFVRHRPPVGQALELTHVRGAMRRAFVRCGIDATGTHILRHTWATWAHRRGASLKLIADVLGHKSLNTTSRYAHLNLEELRHAALPWPRTKK